MTYLTQSQVKYIMGVKKTFLSTFVPFVMGAFVVYFIIQGAQTKSREALPASDVKRYSGTRVKAVADQIKARRQRILALKQETVTNTERVVASSAAQNQQKKTVGSAIAPNTATTPKTAIVTKTVPTNTTTVAPTPRTRAS